VPNNEWQRVAILVAALKIDRLQKIARRVMMVALIRTLRSMNFVAHVGTC
jgi:hypothetical protein